MTKENVLIVDDQVDILELLRYNLAKEHYTVHCARTGEEALRLVQAIVPDLIILDLMLPGMDGLDVCRILKRTPGTAAIPIIMLTARTEDADIVTGLELGADDYVTKPFSPKVLIVRIRTVLRRPGTLPESTRPDIIRVNTLTIDPGRRRVFVEDQAIALTATEFEILYFLSKRPDWVFSRTQIIDAVKGADYPVTDRSIDVQIVNLRKKLGAAAGPQIETVRGVGYRLVG